MVFQEDVVLYEIVWRYRRNMTEVALDFVVDCPFSLIGS